MLTEAGIIGKLGFNSAGLGVCLNAIVTDRLEAGRHAAPRRLRAILDSRTLGDAIGAVARAEHRLLGELPGRAARERRRVDIEAVPGDLDVLLPERDVLAHTNHLLSPRLVGVRCLGKQAFPRHLPSPRLAYAGCSTSAGASSTRMAAREILRDHANAPDSICRHLDEVVDPEGRRLHSVFSLVMDLDAGDARAHRRAAVLG